MDVTAKLQIKPGQRVAALAADGNVPPVVTPDANPSADPGAADAVVAFARNQAELDSVAAPAIEDAETFPATDIFSNTLSMFQRIVALWPTSQPPARAT